jgi:hypothetical protein
MDTTYDRNGVVSFDWNSKRCFLWRELESDVHFFRKYDIFNDFVLYIR